MDKDISCDISYEIRNTLLEQVVIYKERIKKEECNTKELIRISKILLDIGNYIDP